MSASAIDPHTLVSGGISGKLIVWDLRTPEAVSQVQLDDAGDLNCVDANPGGVVAVGSDSGGAQLWDVGNQAQLMKWDVGAVPAVGLSLSGSHVVIGCESGQGLVSANGEVDPLVHRFELGDRISCVAIAPQTMEPCVVLGCWDTTLSVFRFPEPGTKGSLLGGALTKSAVQG